jgi:hypothetical protein
MHSASDELGICRYCGQHRTLIRAHVIPESFFRKERSDAGTLLIVNGQDYPKRSPIGVYDTRLLCADCEMKFGDLDDYAARVLLNDFDAMFEPVLDLGAPVAYVASGVDQDRLMRFFVSLLWRASASWLPFFARVDLGRYAAEARAAVEDRAAPVSSAFGVVLSRWPPAEEIGLGGHGVMDPFAERWDGVNAYRMSLGQMVGYVKVDRRPFPAALAVLALGSDGNAVRVVSRDYLKSNDFKAMVHTVRLNRSNRDAAKLGRASGGQAGGMKQEASES